MTERLHVPQYGAYHHGDTRRAYQSSDEGLGTKKTMLVLVVVVGCFAVLWPKLFYPMLVNNANNQMKPGPVDKTTGCCDVISDMDLNTIKIMSELCGTIIEKTGDTAQPSPERIVRQCRKAVLETCGIDISSVLQDRIVSLGHSVKQILEEVRSLNGSLCLKYNFGVSPWRLGVPHRMHVSLDPANSIRQERPVQIRSEMIHPAFKERGRAIPQSDASGIPKRTGPPPRIVEGRPGPIPGMRPAMGGPGHVVPPSKQSNYGFMGILMPIYTVGFVVFFTYTVMKLVFKKKAETHAGAPLYPPCEPEERFHKEVFEANRNYFNRPNRDTSKIVVNAVSALLEEVNQELEARKGNTPEIIHEHQDEIKANGSLPKEEEQGSVKIMGMETTASSESGKKWSRSDSPVLPHLQPVTPKEPSSPPQQIFLEGSLPPQSQILVAESATETQKVEEDDSPVVLSGKMTLSVISLDSETGTEDSSNSGKKGDASEEERRTSSGNVSEEFEKINEADLEDQINNIIEEAENIASTDENRYNLGEEQEQYSEEYHRTPYISEKDKDSEVLEEIKNQLNLEDDLLSALKDREVEEKVVLPVTDIIKEFLNNEENALILENNILETNEISPSTEESEFADDKIDGLSSQDNNPLEAKPDPIQDYSNLKEEIDVDKDDIISLKQEDSEILEKDFEDENIEKKETLINEEFEKEHRVHNEEISTEEDLDNGKLATRELASGLNYEENDILDAEIEKSSRENGAGDAVEDDPSNAQEAASEIAGTTEESEEESDVEEQEDIDGHVVSEEDVLQAVNAEDELIDNEDYDEETEDEELDDEVSDINRGGFGGRSESLERRLNGGDVSRNGAADRGAASENNISGDDNSDDEENEDEEEIEEIIEYVDNTDEEGEEIIEINGNDHANQNGVN